MRLWFRPILVIAQEIFLVPIIHGGVQKQPSHAQVSHALETAVGRVHSAAHYAESLALDLLGEPVILGE